MDVIVTSMNVIWTTTFKNVKRMWYDYDLKKVFIVDGFGDEYSYASNQILLAVTFN